MTTRALAPWGLKSTAHYLNWRCSIGLTAAREHVRVARVLDALPKISDAFSKGVLSYSKVRAMTRVATPENEQEFLELAIHGTASHIERLAREYRQVRLEVGLDERKPSRVRRTLRHYWDEDGMLVISGRLPAEEGALLFKALEAGVRLAEHEVSEDEYGDSDSTAGVCVQSPEPNARVHSDSPPGAPGPSPGRFRGSVFACGLAAAPIVL